MLPGYVILINLSLVGFFVFPMVSITLEELVMRSNPGYLVTVQVMCTISSQGFAALLVYGASFMFMEPERKKGMNFQLYMCLAYSFLLVLHILTMYF